MERSKDQRRRNRKTTEQTAQSFIAAFLLGTVSGCATMQAPVYNARTARAAAVVLAQPGDTVELIARRYKVSPQAIVETNGLAAPYRLTHGQRLVIPPASVVANWSDAAPAATSPRPRKPRAIAQADYAGDFAAAAPKPKRTTLPKAEPAAATAPADSDEEALDPRLAGARYYALESPRPKPSLDGQGTAEEAVAPAKASTARYAESAPREKPDLDAPYQPPVKAKDQTRDPDAAYDEKPKQRRDVAVAGLDDQDDDGAFQSTADRGSATGRFSWPVRGKVIADFGTLGSGIHNDGLNIAADPNTKVKAADTGTVIYAGNELAGYGNLLLVRHAGGFVTAYAHNKKLLVKRGAKVARGDIIALVGATGDVDRPQLHFEIRKGDRAVDPNRYLARETASR